MLHLSGCPACSHQAFQRLVYSLEPDQLILPQQVPWHSVQSSHLDRFIHEVSIWGRWQDNVFHFPSVYSYIRVRVGLPCRCSPCLGFWSHIPYYEEQALAGWPVGTTTPFPKFITKLLCLWYHTSLHCVCAVTGMCFDFVGVTVCYLVQSFLLCFALVLKRTEQITTLIYLHSTPAPFP